MHSGSDGCLGLSRVCERVCTTPVVFSHVLRISAANRKTPISCAPPRLPPCLPIRSWTYALDFNYLRYPCPAGGGKCTMKHFVRRRRWFRTRVREALDMPVPQPQVRFGCMAFGSWFRFMSWVRVGTSRRRMIDDVCAGCGRRRGRQDAAW